MKSPSEMSHLICNPLNNILMLIYDEVPERLYCLVEKEIKRVTQTLEEDKLITKRK